MRQALFCAVLCSSLAACGGAPAQSGSTTPTPEPGPTGDACDGETLPACPPPCAEPAGQRAGATCSTEGERCGNDIGDGCTCSGGTWQCTVHPPLKPVGCNKVCR